jgi:Domain of unknown function (DUF5615)
MSALVATLLRSRGLDITTVPEQSTLGKTDRQQLEFATSMGRCILTHNRVDFERLHLQHNKSCSIFPHLQPNLIMSLPSIFGRSPFNKGSIAALRRSLSLWTTRHENIYRYDFMHWQNAIGLSSCEIWIGLLNGQLSRFPSDPRTRYVDHFLKTMFL